jgi:hypothetical protein
VENNRYPKKYGKKDEEEKPAGKPTPTWEKEYVL